MNDMWKETDVIKGVTQTFCVLGEDVGELRTACAYSAPKTIVCRSAMKGSFQRSVRSLCCRAKMKKCSEVLTYVGTSW